MENISIIGGGAAGLVCAIVAAKQARACGADVRVRVFEATDKVGRSILRSGNGRCNFSNANIEPEVYRNSGFVESALAEFETVSARWRYVGCGVNAADAVVHSGANSQFMPPNGVVAFFAQLGLLWRQESEGRLYPYANKASAVLDALRFELDRLGVEIITDAQVKSVEEPRAAGKPFTLRMADGAFERASQVVVACGGKVARDFLPRKTLSGQELLYSVPRPVLGPLAVAEKCVKRLDNIRVRCAVSLIAANDGHLISKEHGEVLFRKYGVSGIAIFNLSRLARQNDKLRIDFITEIAPDEMQDFLSSRAQMLRFAYGKKIEASQLLSGIVLPQVAQVLLECAGVGLQQRVTDEVIAQVSAALKRFELTVSGIGDEGQCQVSRGGFAPSQINPKTMQFSHVEGLFMTGEALDVDAPCGGYNLHWAFATGALAGIAAANAAAGGEGRAAAQAQ